MKHKCVRAFFGEWAPIFSRKACRMFGHRSLGSARNRRAAYFVYLAAEGIRVRLASFAVQDSLFPRLFFRALEVRRDRAGRCIVGDTSSSPTFAGVTQLVESQPSKLLVAGSSPVSRSKKRYVLKCLAAWGRILKLSTPGLPR